MVQYQTMYANGGTTFKLVPYNPPSNAKSTPSPTPAAMDWISLFQGVSGLYLSALLLTIICLFVVTVLAAFSDMANIFLTFALGILVQLCSFLLGTASKALKWAGLLLMSILLVLLGVIVLAGLVVMKVLSGTAGVNFTALKHVLLVVIPSMWLVMSEACEMPRGVVDGVERMVFGEEEGASWRKPIVIE
ncbi:MAG: hypothetical protein Q9202_000032 [Teloschistes flavicans]